MIVAIGSDRYCIELVIKTDLSGITLGDPALVTPAICELVIPCGQQHCSERRTHLLQESRTGSRWFFVPSHCVEKL